MPTWAVQLSGHFTPYTQLVSSQIEASYRHRDTEANVTIEGRSYVIVLTEPMYQHLASDPSCCRDVRRINNYEPAGPIIELSDDEEPEMCAVTTVVAPAAKPLAPVSQWRLEESDGDGLITEDQLLSSGFTIGRAMYLHLGPDLYKFVSLKQAVLRVGSDGTHLVCESTGRNPTGVKAAGSSSWTRLLRGETAQLRPGDELAPVFNHSPEASPFVVLQIDTSNADSGDAGALEEHVTSASDAAVAGPPSQLGKRKVDDASSVPMVSQVAPHQIDDWLARFSFAGGVDAGGAGPSSPVSPSTTKAPRHRSNKEEQAWLYPDFKIQRAPSLYINGKKYVDPKSMPEERPRRVRESNFKLLINPNKVVPEDLREVADAVWEGGHSSVKAGLWDGSCVSFGPTDPEEYGSDRAKDVIIDVAFHAVTEVGEKVKRLHAHPIVKMKHYSQLHLSTRGIMKAFKKGYNRSLESLLDKEASAFKAARIRHALKMHGEAFVQLSLMNSDKYNEVMTRYAFKDNQDACPL